jgi:hypothetical protein
MKVPPIPHRIRTISVPVFSKDDVFHVVITKAEARRLLEAGVFELVEDDGGASATIEPRDRP